MYATIQSYDPTNKLGVLSNGNPFMLRDFRGAGGWMRSPHCRRCQPGTCPWADDPPPPIPGERVLVQNLEIIRVDAPLVRVGDVTEQHPDGYWLVDLIDGGQAKTWRPTSVNRQLRGYLGADGFLYHTKECIPL